MSSTTEADPPYSIDLIKVGEADVRGPEVWWMSHWEEWETLFFQVVVVRGQGRTLLINTGPPPDMAALNRVWVEYSGHQRAAMRAVVDPVEGLARLGIAPEEVTDILLSPFQAYSVANVARFPRARICFSRTGWIAFHAPRFTANHTTSREGTLPRDVLIYLVTDAWPRVRLLEDEDELLPGLRVFRAGVHHPESMAAAIPTAKGTAVWTDGLFKLGNFEAAHPVGVTESLDESRALQARISGIAAIVLPAFDDTLFERYPGGHVA
jgi:glyoxylase-like metal-dependent hydrolase (beta-lactamase superfamily II)